MKKSIITIAIVSLLLLSLVFSTTVSPIENEDSLSIKDGNRVYIDTTSVYISASPHTLTADGYVYLNITSKGYDGEIDLCFGFDSKLGYPRSLELYDPKTETTQHELDLNPYWDNPQYKVDFSNFTSKQGETLYYGCVSVYHNTSIINENNQTIGWEWTNVLEQYYDIGYLDTKIVYWNTTQTSYWTSIREDLNFDKKSFSYQGMETWYLANATIQQNKEYYLRMWLTIIPTLDDITHEFLIGLKPHSETLEQATLNGHFHYLDPWYNDDWQYRKSHTINYASGAGTNYAVMVTVHYDAGPDYDDDVYLNGKCQSDFDDIRFTDDDGETLLDYWLEKKVNSDYATFWIEVTDSLSYTNANIYLYYGNAEATTTSNGDNAFIFFDNFDGEDIDTDKWDVTNPDQFSLADSWVTITGDSSPIPKLSSVADVPAENVSIEAYLDVNSLGSTALAGFRVNWDTPNDGAWWYTESDNWDRYLWFNGVGSWKPGTDRGMTTGEVRFGLAKTDGKIRMFTSGSRNFDDDFTGTTDNADRVLKVAVYSGYTVKIDWIFIRNYIDGYNPHGAWGAEDPRGDAWYSFAFLIWGTRDYPVVMGGDDERDLSETFSIYVFDLVDDTQRYGNNVHNYWGDPTEPNNVYTNVSNAETNFNYTAIFYKGHSINTSCSVEGCTFEEHYAIYADEGYGAEYIIDYLIHNETSSGTHDFVFLWTCGYGEDDKVGEIDENGHSWGMLASWMNINGTDLSSDGYDEPDYSDHVFISFENISIWFTNYTTYDDFQYAHFAYLFFDYALNGPFTIRDALDLAAEDTHGSEAPSFGDCQLCTGYEIWNPMTQTMVIGKMRVWGDGDHMLPN